MNPYQVAKSMYDGTDVASIIGYCAENGFVHSDIDCFVCAYPTSKCAIETKSKIVLDKPDTWYVYIAVGNLKKAFQFIEPKKYLAFERYDGRIRVYDFERFRRKLWAVSGIR